MIVGDPGRHWLARHGRHGGVGFGATLLSVADGAGRGTRVLDLVAGPDLSVRIAVDRGFEIAEVTTRGVAVGWSSPAHLRSPALHEHAEDDQMGFLRSFSGMLTTCGLDRFGHAGRESADFLGYAARRDVVHPMHGRSAFLPATLDGYGIGETEAGRVVWAQGTMVQAMVFGEHLVLTRRIEVPLFGSRLDLIDSVANRGSRANPHAMLYHWDFGWPLLAEGSRITVPESDILWCSDDIRAAADPAAGLIAQGPVDGYGELVFGHAVRPPVGGVARAQVCNPELGLTATLAYRPAELPVLLQWQAYEPGIYALGIEPATGPLGEPGALLPPDATRSYTQSLELAWA